MASRAEEKAVSPGAGQNLGPLLWGPAEGPLGAAEQGAPWPGGKCLWVSLESVEFTAAVAQGCPADAEGRRPIVWPAGRRNPTTG